jgi:hypothetical protein
VCKRNGVFWLVLSLENDFSFLEGIPCWYLSATQLLWNLVLSTGRYRGRLTANEHRQRASQPQEFEDTENDIQGLTDIFES